MFVPPVHLHRIFPLPDKLPGFVTLTRSDERLRSSPKSQHVIAWEAAFRLPSYLSTRNQPDTPPTYKHPKHQIQSKLTL